MTPTTGPGGDATKPPSCISMNSGAAIVSGPSCGVGVQGVGIQDVADRSSAAHATLAGGHVTVGAGAEQMKLTYAGTAAAAAAKALPRLTISQHNWVPMQEVTHGCDRLAMSQHAGLLSHKVDGSEFVPQAFCRSQLKLQSGVVTWMLDARRKQERVLPATPLTWISPMHGSRSRSAAARSMTSPLAPAGQSSGNAP